MKPITTWLLQSLPGTEIDVWGEILKLGGVFSLLLTVALVVVWTKYQAVIKYIIKDALANMAIVQSLDKNVERSIEEDDKREQRIVSHLNEIKDITRRNHDGKSDANTPG